MCSILRNKTLIVNLAYGTKAARENIDKEYSYRKIGKCLYLTLELPILADQKYFVGSLFQ